MTIGTEYEEKQKDDILQEIHNKLDKYDWGGGCDRLVIKVVFRGKYNLKPIIVQNKEAERIVRIFGTI